MIQNIVMPKLSAIMKKGKITEIIAKEKKLINKGDILLNITAEKANVDIEAPIDGYVSIVCEVGEEYDVGETIAYIASTIDELAKEKNVEKVEKSEKEEVVDKSINNKKRIRALPIAKRIAKENDIDLTNVKGTGENGLITKKDVEEYLSNNESNNFLEILELDSVKQSMVEHMELTKNYVKGTTFMDVDFYKIKELRKTKKHSYTSFIAYAISRALTKYPLINSSFSDNKIYMNKNINLGVAVDYEGKLYVPVIKNANTLGIEEIESKIKQYQDDAVNDKINFEDLSDGTFTLTNSGIFGSLAFLPIMNYPQSAILGIGKIADKPVVYNNEIVIRPILIMSLSYDHRIIPGSVAVKFLATVKEILENPEDFQ